MPIPIRLLGADFPNTEAGTTWNMKAVDAATVDCLRKDLLFIFGLHNDRVTTL